MTTPAPLLVSLVRHAAPASWGSKARAALAKALRTHGVSLTEASDARELMGHARLSDASDWDRAHALENLDSPEFVVALAEVRRRRLDLTEALLTVSTGRAARVLLQLDRPTLQLRLGELAALYAQCRVLELVAEAAPKAPAKAPAWTEEELFGGVVGR